MKVRHCGLDRGESRLEIRITNRVFDVHVAEAFVVDTALLQPADVLAAQRDHQVRGKVLGADLCAPMPV